MALAKFTINDWIGGFLNSVGGKSTFTVATTLTSSTGTEIGTAGSPLVTSGSGAAATAGTNLSGTVTAVSGAFNLPASATRKPGDVQGQNVSATLSLAFNEFNGTAALNTAGSYTVGPGQTFSITTNNQVNFISTGNCPVTITGI